MTSVFVEITDSVALKKMKSIPLKLRAQLHFSKRKFSNIISGGSDYQCDQLWPWLDAYWLKYFISGSFISFLFQRETDYKTTLALKFKKRFLDIFYSFSLNFKGVLVAKILKSGFSMANCCKSTNCWTKYYLSLILYQWYI